MESARRILKPFLALCVLFVSVTVSFGQTDQYDLRNNSKSEIHNEQCASHIVHEMRIQNDPAFAQQVIDGENAIKEHLAQGQTAHFGQVYTIPVVVHVIHTGEAIGVGANISDEQIQSAINALNEDYRRVAGTNGAGNGVDVEMEFCLALRDPSGNATSGIVRVDGSSVPNYATEGISVGQGFGASEASVKSLSNWPTADYYNIWIVNEIENNDGGSGIQGFAYFPNNTLIDGATIIYNAFGTTGNLKPYTSLNRVATHEIGHGFNLYHTFQGGICTENNCAVEGDKVCDTPPTSLNTNCNSPACSGAQMVDNYMDYTSESCQNMFTQGQKDRMRASAETMRSSLLNSLGCTPVTNVDVATTGIIHPSGDLCSSSFEPQITITNFGSSTLTSMNINYYVDASASQTFNWTGNLTTAATETVTLPTVNTTSGEHTLHIYTSDPNGVSDENQTNDLASIPFEVIDGQNVEIKVTLDNYGGDNSWEIMNSSGTVIASGGPYQDFNLGQINISDVCLEEGCYDFIMYDEYGDGMCCTYGFGGFEVILPDGSVAASGGTFTNVESTNFCLSAQAQLPSADMSASATNICEGMSIDFNDQSDYTPTSWNWTFEGGTPSSSTEENPQNITYNSPGTYDVTLEVSNTQGSDTKILTGHITVNAQPVIIGTIIDASCANSNDGQIDIEVSNWTPGIDFDWSNGYTSQNATMLESGLYSLSIQDNAGCQASASFTVGAPEEIDVQAVSLINATCNGESNGSIEVSVSGGVSGYNLIWNDGAAQSGTTASGLPAGTYHVNVTDANGCAYSEGFVINEPSAIMPSKVYSIPDSCMQGIGMAQIEVSGGTPEYNIVWNDPLSTQGEILVNALSGQYSATISDANNCEKTASVWIDEIGCGGGSVGVTDFTASSTVVCQGNSIDFMDNSDFEGTSWSWTFEGGTPETSNEQFPQGITYNAPGTYYVSLSISNADGSDAEVKNAFITVTSAPTLTGVITDATCFDSSDGEINLQVNDATSGITYEWSNGYVGQDPSGLPAGEHSVTIIDGAGCVISGNFTIGSPDEIGAETIYSMPDSCDLGTGMAEISVFGGTPNYNIQWDDPAFQSGQILMNVSTGEYNALITDMNACQKTVTVWVDDINCDGTVDVEDQILADQISIFPNPLGDGMLTLHFGNLGVSSMDISLFNMAGKAIKQEVVSSFSERYQLYLEEFSAGMYLLKIETDMGQFTERLIIRKN